MSSNGDSTKSDSEESKNTETAIKRQQLDFFDECANTQSDYKCMVTFKVGKTHQELVQVPCCLLALKSQVFQKMFFGLLKETSEVQIPDAEPDTFKTFVRYLITPLEEHITDENVYELLYLANKYSINDLVVMCEQYLAHLMRLENVVSILNLSVRIDSQFLLKRTMEFIIKNQMQLFPSDCFNDCTRDSIAFLLESSHLVVAEDEILNMLQTWVSEELKRKNLPLNGVEKKEILKPLMKLIRLHCLSRQTCIDLLHDENCPGEAKSDLQLLLQESGSFCFAKYFCNSSRLSLGQALRCKGIFFERTHTVNLLEKEHNIDLTIVGLLVEMITENYRFKIFLENKCDCKNSRNKMEILGKECVNGYCLVFVPNNGYLVQGKTQIRMEFDGWRDTMKKETDYFAMKIQYNVFSKGFFECANKNNINITFKTGNKCTDTGLIGLLYQVNYNNSL